MDNLGLALIVFGWAIQYFHKGKNMSPLFVISYIAGVAVLTVEGVANNLYSPAVLNLATLVVSLAVFFKINKK